MKSIYLLRHPHIDGQNKIVGSQDIALSNLGLSQASYWQNQLKEQIFYKIYSSELSRTYESAKIITAGAEVKKLPAFNEINLGEWEGKEKKYIQENQPDLWKLRGENPENIAPPEGENFNQLQNRVLPQFFELVQSCPSDKQILIVGHQAVNRVILAYYSQIALRNISVIIQDYACLNIINFVDGFDKISYFECPIME